ncbi:hypothetical protein HWV62_35694 [Athelia sp. TMB]|nr:hypothetical protein HWV62_35694 [Athelia sp. TMB]
MVLMTLVTAIDNEGDGRKKRDLKEMELYQDVFCNTHFLAKPAGEVKIGAVVTKAKEKKIERHSPWDYLPQGNVAGATLLEGDIVPDLLPEYLLFRIRQQTPPLDRVHTRLVLETDQPIIFAKSLLMFVGAMRDVIKDIIISNGMTEYDTLLELGGGMVVAVYSEQQIEHLPVHDLEEFPWVPVHFCLSRDVPAHQRAELSQEVAAETNELIRHYALLFAANSDSSLANFKRSI